MQPPRVSWRDLAPGDLRGKVAKFTNCKLYRADVRGTVGLSSHGYAAGSLVNDDLWIRDGVIIDPAKRFWEAATLTEFACDVIVDCGGLLLSPGFIDIQLNGGFGVDFSNPPPVEPGRSASILQETGLGTVQPPPHCLADEAAVAYVCRALLQHGVTAFCPTLVSSSEETYKRAVAVFRNLREWDAAQHAAAAAAERDSGSTGHDKLAPPAARRLGLHLEGPFIHPERKGAHALHNLAAPESGLPALCTRYGLSKADLAAGEAAIVTLAPELPGALEAVEALSALGVITSTGHTTADVATAAAAVARGSTCVTHLFNAMEGFHHRDPGVVGLLGKGWPGHAAAVVPTQRPQPSAPVPVTPFSPLPRRTPLLRDTLYYGLIVDGVHCHPWAVSIALSSHPAGAIVVTDAMQALGLPAGSHRLGELEVDIWDAATGPDGAVRHYKGPHAVISGTATLAGAVLSLDAAVRNLVAFTGCDVCLALAAVTAHPAAALGLTGVLGSLATGAWADLVLLDPITLTPQQTIVAGVVAWTAGAGA